MWAFTNTIVRHSMIVNSKSAILLKASRRLLSRHNSHGLIYWCVASKPVPKSIGWPNQALMYALSCLCASRSIYISITGGGLIMSKALAEPETTSADFSFGGLRDASAQVQITKDHRAKSRAECIHSWIEGKHININKISDETIHSAIA